MGEVRAIRSGKNQFLENARMYLAKGWHPIPIAEKKKFPPLVGTTGAAAPEITLDMLQEWSMSHLKTKDESWEGANSNLGLHMHEVVHPRTGEPILIKNHLGEEVPAEVFAIDVDAKYKGKTGDETIASLEKKLGPLPETWISSARNNGVSGIRYYLVPSGYSWRGSLGKDSSVDLINRKYRFAMVYPSYHPDSEEVLGEGNGKDGAGQYLWFRPGQSPDGWASSTLAQVAAGDDVSGTIPNAWELPELPMPWVEMLSNKFILFSDTPIDTNTPTNELFKKWRGLTKREYGSSKGDIDFLKEQIDEVGCSYVKERADLWEKELRTNHNSHETVLSCHWEAIRMASEGHSGLGSAVALLDAVFTEHVLGGDGGEQKRGAEEIRGELFRSKSYAVRKLFGELGYDDSLDQIDIDKLDRVVVPQCACYEGDGDELFGEEFSGVVSGNLADPKSYERNDDGNAEHFLNLFDGNVKYVAQQEQWICWDPVMNRWSHDEKGKIRRAWRMVKRRQVKYAQQLMRQAFSEQDPDKRKELLTTAREWKRWAENSGNNVKAKNALEAAQSFHGISLDFTEVDAHPELLGVDNGILELTEDGAKLRISSDDNFKELLITRNTGIPYIRWDNLLDLAKKNPDSEAGVAVKLWMNYLDTFLPNEELRAWVQQLMGYCLYGSNPARKLIFLYGSTSTGKSTMLRAVMAALGKEQYSSSETMDIFNPDSRNPEIISAIDHRVITLSEIDDKEPVSSAMLKKIAGMDSVKARKNHSNDFIMKVPAFTPVFATNHAPNIDKGDGALDRRIVIVPFNTTVVEEDEMRSSQIEDICPIAVLSWMVEGWKSYGRNRLKNEPNLKELKEARDKFRNELTPLGEFFDESCVIIDGADAAIEFETRRDLYQAYVNFCKRNGIDRPWSNIKFGKELGEAGFKRETRKVDGKSVKVSYGIKLKKKLAKDDAMKFEK